MSLADMLLVGFCWIDGALRHQRLDRPRSRGPAPILSDAEVICIEVVGELLGLSCDTAIYSHFRRHHRADFPAPARVHRATFLRRAANPWRVRQALHKELAARLIPDDACWLADSVPLYAASSAARSTAGCPAGRRATATTTRRGRPTVASGCTRGPSARGPSASPMIQR